MILYFSASGNSQASAVRLAELVGEKVQSILEVAPDKLAFEGNSLGIIFPIYSWGVPPIVLEYISRLNSDFSDAVRDKKPVWMVCTCGDDIAMAPEMLKKALRRVGLSLSGGWSLQMPNTYLLLPGFALDSKPLENEKLAAAYPRLSEIAGKIKSGEWEENYVRGGMPRLKSGVVYPLFKKWGVFPSRWHATEACIGCGKCAEVCPVANITLSMGGGSEINTPKKLKRVPSWGKKCISCMACYHHCPINAVQYGKLTYGKGQYVFPGW